MTSRHAIEQRRKQALADLADVERQLASGELDTETAVRLIATYREEADAAEAAMVAAEPEDQDEATGRRSGRRVVLGAAVLVLGAAAAVYAVTQAVEPREGGEFVTGGLPDTAATRDLADVTNEELEVVIAENPDIVPMRLALARRYVEEGSFSEALGHYMVVLEDGPHPEALAYVGWMTYLSGDPQTAEGLLERSLAQEPENGIALWFLANTRFEGLGDAAGALPLLDTLSQQELPDDVRDAVIALRRDVVADLEGS